MRPAFTLSENGKNVSDNVMIAFGGAAPLHAARLCEKLGIDHCLIPPGAGVGSAIGFLRAPFGFEALASRLVRLSDFDVESVNSMLSSLRESAESFVRAGTGRRHSFADRGVHALQRTGLGNSGADPGIVC